MSAPLITEAMLAQLAPQCHAASLAAPLNSAAIAHAIITPLRIAHWLAQGATESLGFTVFEESLNYTAERLHAVWPARFPSVEAAAPYAHDPRKLADAVYGGRMGNVERDDGWTFRGRGIFQLTGRDAYAEVGRICGMGFVAAPDQLATPSGAAASAGGFWAWKAINPLADADDLDAVTRRVNGGLNGLTDRAFWLHRAKHIWTA